MLSSKTSGPKNLTENHTAIWEEATDQQEKARMVWGERKGGVWRTRPRMADKVGKVCFSLNSFSVAAAIN